MTKSVEDCQKFVDAYNKAFDEGRNEFNFEIRLNDGRIIKRTFKVRGFKIKLNEEKKVKALLRGQNKFISEEGASFCPCKLQHIDSNICPNSITIIEAENVSYQPI